MQDGELAEAQVSRCVLRVDALGSPGENRYELEQAGLLTSGLAEAK